jgi:anti-anti-sigma factor
MHRAVTSHRPSDSERRKTARFHGLRDSPKPHVAEDTSGLKIRTGDSGLERSIALLGEFNQATYELAAEALEQALESDAQTIVLDLTALEAMDHAGVRAVLIAHQRASDQRKQFLIVPGPDPVQQVLDAVHGPFRYTPRQPHQSDTEDADHQTGPLRHG